MSDYGADENPSIPAAQDLAYTKSFMPLKKTNVMQWTYPDDVTVRKLANKTGKSNCLFKFAPPPPPPVIPPSLFPVPAGDACTTCWGNGKPFGVGETPQFLTVVIAGVEKGPGWMAGDGEPPNAFFVVAQSPALPCSFIRFTADISISFRLAPFVSILQAINLPSGAVSFFATGTECQTFYENTETDKFTGGTGTIFIHPIS